MLKLKRINPLGRSLLHVTPRDVVAVVGATVMRELQLAQLTNDSSIGDFGETYLSAKVITAPNPDQELMTLVECYLLEVTQQHELRVSSLGQFGAEPLEAALDADDEQLRRALLQGLFRSL